MRATATNTEVVARRRQVWEVAMVVPWFRGVGSAADVDTGDLVELGQLGQAAVQVGALHVGGDNDAVAGVAGGNGPDVEVGHGPEGGDHCGRGGARGPPTCGSAAPPPAR